MELIIPSRNKPTTGSFPTAPKKVRQWLSGLYPLTSANATQTLMRGLKHCNRLENAPRARMEILDIFKPAVREIIDAAVARYFGQNLPLSSRDYNSFRNVTTLLQELAYGYKIVAAEATQSAIPGATKFRYHAMILAMDTLNEIALRHLQVYEDIPADIWQDCNTLYALAEELGISRKPLGKEAGSQYNVDTIEEIFSATHLLYLSGSHSLRRGQIVQLHEFIANNAKLASLLSGEEQSNDAVLTYAIDLECARTCQQLTLYQCCQQSECLLP